MNGDELHFPDLLEFDVHSSALRFAAQPVLLLTADALAALRQQLSERLGAVATRAVLTQVGVAQGWQMAGALDGEFPCRSEEERRRAGAHLGRLMGLFQGFDGLSAALGPFGLELSSSFEAKEHLARFGVSTIPTCATICGFLSGFLSRIEGQDLIAVEEQCQACGASACRFLVRTREAWVAARHASEPARLQECLDFEGSPNSENVGLRKAEGVLDVDDVPGVVTHSVVMREAVSLALRLAEVDSTVLITGESGTGKERIARLIHDRSKRRQKPFIAVNCGAIAEELLESELFGHARGSFTGAIQAHVGIFEAANHGTILLDEIGEISPGMQIKLLRVLQEREVRRVGEEKSRPVDFRVLAATNRDLAHEVELGNFRQDLYYRLHVVEVHVPALRARREDILPLACDLLAESAARMQRELMGFSPAAAEKLLSHGWPGNVRELENAMERAVALARGSRVELSDLPEEILEKIAEHPATLQSVRPLQDISKDYILAALSLNYGNQTHTAKQLGIGTATLYRKLRSYGHQSPENLDPALPPIES